MNKPTYQEFLETLRSDLVGRTDINMAPYATVTYQTLAGPKPYELMKIASTDIGPTDPIALIRATIHGDEPGGSYTLMRHIGEIFDYAHARGVKLIIYPMDNPSGYEAGTRYNIEGDHGDAGNNDFMRYQLADGTLTDDIGTGNEFAKWYWSSDPELNIHLPKETIALHDELKKLPLAQVRACLDIHQDNYLKVPAAYHYAFGDTSRYRAVVAEIEKVATVIKNEDINSGYFTKPEDADKVAHGEIVPDHDEHMSDTLGFIIRHDGTLPDLFDRLGAAYTVTVETVTSLPPETVDAVNLAWICGIVDLI